jgi:hypothetical protein
MALVYPPISRSLHSNGSTRYNVVRKEMNGNKILSAKTSFRSQCKYCQSYPPECSIDLFPHAKIVTAYPVRIIGNRWTISSRGTMQLRIVTSQCFVTNHTLRAITCNRFHSLTNLFCGCKTHPGSWERRNEHCHVNNVSHGFCILH